MCPVRTVMEYVTGFRNGGAIPESKASTNSPPYTEPMYHVQSHAHTCKIPSRNKVSVGFFLP